MATLTFGRMSRTLKITLIVPAVIVLAGFLAIQAVQQRRSAERSDRQFSEDINLALRRTAHRLLSIAGNRTSAIPPVQRIEGNTWLVRLEQNFDYDSLPPLLHEAFLLHGIAGKYNVTVLDCRNNDLMLGYMADSHLLSADVACGGRDQTAGCYNLSVTFPNRQAGRPEETGLWILFALVCLFLPAYSVFRSFNKLKNKTLELAPAAVGTSNIFDPTQRTLVFGQSSLFVANQKLVTKGKQKDLTYRETKLLWFFCLNINKLLERDIILKAVWEDEGILVGRSVDVFVSRLRKLLKDDDSLRIVNVHGVGYRLETVAPSKIT